MGKVGVSITHKGAMHALLDGIRFRRDKQHVDDYQRHRRLAARLLLTVAEENGVEQGALPHIPLEPRFTHITTFRKGKVVLAEFFWDHQEALEAAGLRK